MNVRFGLLLLLGFLYVSSVSGGELPSAQRTEVALPESSVSFQAGRSMQSPRAHHTATLLSDGRILVAGGSTSQTQPSVASAEIYDPVTGNWMPTGSMNNARSWHAATLLQNGMVFVVGKAAVEGSTGQAELYNPTNGKWTALNNPPLPASFIQTATLLKSGKVFVTAFYPGLQGAIYDPTSGTWSSTPSLPGGPRNGYTATLLQDGRVLIAGGTDENIDKSISSAAIYDPGTNSWTNASNMATARAGHSATVLTNGDVLVAGGGDVVAYASSEVYHVSTNTWTKAGNMSAGRWYHSATLLPNGTVLAAGGDITIGTTADTYDPATGMWSSLAQMTSAHVDHTATLLSSGKLMIAGGYASNAPYTPVANVDMFDASSGYFTTTGTPAASRVGPTATLLPNGKVLLASGQQIYNGPSLLTCELYDPATGSFSSTGSLHTGRYYHTATLLLNGKVFVAGGSTAPQSCEIYDPQSGTWTVAANCPIAAFPATTTLLPDGKVLVAGGQTPTFPFPITNQAFLYDPLIDSWIQTGNMTTARTGHRAVLLRNGKVLVAGGSSYPTAELYDPVAGTWSATGSMMQAGAATASLLANGTVLVTHGSLTAELYNPDAGTWRPTTPLASLPNRPTATLLPNGRMMFVGGYDSGNAVMYDPVTESWQPGGVLNAARDEHTATLLQNGKVLITSGFPEVSGGDSNPLPAELFDSELGFTRPDWQPQITSSPRVLSIGAELTISGSRFRGLSESSSGATQNSPSDHPVVQIRRIDNEEVSYLSVDPAAGWSDTSFISQPVNNILPGPALITVFTNGIPSDSTFVTIPPPLLPGAAVSRKSHGTIGVFDVNLPLSGQAGVECRSGGAGGTHTLVVTFSNPLSNATVAISSGIASFADTPVIFGDSVTVNLTAVADAQTVILQFSGLVDSFGQSLTSANVSAGFLLGDTNGDGVVNSADATITRNDSGSSVDATKFRADYNTDGAINSADATIARDHSGNSLPAAPIRLESLRHY